MEYRRDGFVEWYVNGPLGVEQGFTVAEVPGCEGERGRELVVELSVGPGLTAEMGEDGKGVELRDASGKRVLGYSELYATDATGKALSARLGVTGEGVSILVATSGATYPVVIDPLIWTEQQKLLASDGTAVSGWAISGDTLVATGTSGLSLYVFVRSGSTWVQQSEIPTDDCPASSAVAISGDTVIVGAPSYFGQPSGLACVFVRSGSTWLCNRSYPAWLKDLAGRSPSQEI